MNFETLWRKGFPWFVGGALALILINTAFYYVGIANLDNLTKTFRARAQQNRTTLSDLESKAETLGDSVGRINRGRAFMESLAAGVLKTRAQRVVEMQAEIHKLMKDTGVTTDGLSYGYEILPAESEKKGWRHRYIKTNIGVSVAGSYPQVKKFLDALYRSTQFFTVESLSVGSSAQGTVVLKADLAVSTIFIASEWDGVR